MMKKMTSAECKAIGRDKLLGHYGTVIAALLISLMITLILNVGVLLFMDTSTIGQMILYYLASILITMVSGIFSVGLTYLFLKLHCAQPISAVDVYYGFQNNSGKIGILVFIMTILSEMILLPISIFTELYTQSQNSIYMMLLSFSLVVCGVIVIIFKLNYSQIYFLLLDFPDYSAGDVLRYSAQIMKGHKGRLFYIHISFIPLFLLGLLSFGIGYLWIVPYMRSTLTAFYLDLMRNSNTI